MPFRPAAVAAKGSKHLLEALRSRAADQERAGGGAGRAGGGAGRAGGGASLCSEDTRVFITGPDAMTALYSIVPSGQGFAVFDADGRSVMLLHLDEGGEVDGLAAELGKDDGFLLLHTGRTDGTSTAFSARIEGDAPTSGRQDIKQAVQTDDDVRDIRFAEGSTAGTWVGGRPFRRGNAALAGHGGRRAAGGE